MKLTNQCWNNITNPLRYLEVNWTRGIYYSKRELNFFSYSVSSFEDDLYSRPSTAGYVFILNHGPIFWSNRRQEIVSISTCKAEYIAKAKTTFEAFWLWGLLEELGFLETIIEEVYSKTVSPPTTLFADNQGGVKIMENLECLRKSKHILIKYHKTQELVAEWIVHFEWIPTNKMVANGLTKPLDICKFRMFVEMLGMVNRKPIARLMGWCCKLILAWWYVHISGFLSFLLCACIRSSFSELFMHRLSCFCPNTIYSLLSSSHVASSLFYACILRFSVSA